ncbi:MAG: hypothetical protein H6Q00_3466 [Holophagaceae bacterium]|nr:hypothetical protein [Holophagaceae bacterium]
MGGFSEAAGGSWWASTAGGLQPMAMRARVRAGMSIRYMGPPFSIQGTVAV